PDALELVEAGASRYLVQSAMQALATQYVKQQRQAEIGRLQRKAKPVRAGQRTLVPGIVRLKIDAIDPADLAAMDMRLNTDRDVILHRLFEVNGDEGETDVGGLTREQTRQIARRASRTLASIAATDPHFVVMAEYAAGVAAAAADADPKSAAVPPSPRSGPRPRRALRQPLAA
ncbi:MAG: hypothetical protein RIS17_1125, partial [Pseudomonadota bacterium]